MSISIAVQRRALPQARNLLDDYQAPDGFVFMSNGCGLATGGGGLEAVVAAGEHQICRAASAAQHLFDEAGAADPSTVVVGALPFDGEMPALLRLPGRTVRRPPDGPAWEVVIDAGAPDSRDADAAPPAGATTPRPEPAAADYVAAVTEAVRRIRDGRLRKVVLARSLLVAAPHSAQIRGLLHALAFRDPLAHVFAAPSAPGGLVMGASPEMLVRRSGRAVISTPLAGTTRRHRDPVADREAAQALRHSAKDNGEHAIVVEAVVEALRPHCTAVSVAASPSLHCTATVWHLATEIHGVLRDPEMSALALAGVLHPTPAVGGAPRDAALQCIRELEAQPRGLYAGVVGWVDGRGDGEWAISLRCLEIDGSLARLSAGAGIVADSNPTAELAETDAKLETMLSVLGLG